MPKDAPTGDEKDPAGPAADGAKRAPEAPPRLRDHGVDPGLHGDGRARGAERDRFDVGFVIVPEFPLLSLSGAVDVMRHANRFAPEPYYRFEVLGLDRAPVRASNGLEIQVDRALDEVERLDRLFVVSGFDPARATDPRLLAWIRKLARRGVPIGGVSAGAFILARAGVLDGRNCAVHWEYAGAFEEMWPSARLTNRLYVVEPDRMTCAGGAATIDMVLRLVSADLGPEIAAKAAEQMLVDRVRTEGDRQTSAALFRAKARAPALAKAIRAMESRLDRPLGMDELSDIVGLTRRQLHRLFREHTGAAPTDFYRDLRLRHARQLLRQTPLKVIDVALASGFGSHSHFSKVYRDEFGVTPLEDRRSV